MNKEERIRQLETLAQENNWSFSVNGNVAAIEKFEFQTGEKRQVDKIENLIEGDGFKVFDVYWKTDFKPSDAFGPLAHKDNSAQKIQQQTMFLNESMDLRLKKFYVYPAESNNWLNNWIDKAFLQSNFADYPEFEKRWVVRGSVKQLLNKEVIGFYEKSDNFWTFANENNLFIYQPNVLIEPAQILDWVKRTETLAKLLKS
jgi:hypothetical protein